MIELIRGDRKVEWVDLGEGWNGDYDHDDPLDQALLRFDVLELRQVREPTHADDDAAHEWVCLDDASYCTQMPAVSSDTELRRGAEIIMSATWGKSNIKKVCEQLSWISPDWCDGTYYYPFGHDDTPGPVGSWDLPEPPWKDEE
jgi:hypothetical protein|tara:strand:- start:191 stop:622 length:432 start_codon:yes stop_codon:yes gene_type:complete